MSRHAPGTQDWWRETAMIAALGVGLAAWLWDGPPPIASIDTVASGPQPRTLADLLDAGCLTQEHLQAMREGRQLRVDCPVAAPEPVLLRDLPPEQRPFP